MSELLLIVGMLGALVLPSTARGQNINEARDAYNAGEYQTVVEALEPYVGSERPGSDDVYLVQDSRRYLAAAYVLLGRRDDAVRQFQWMLREFATDRATGRLSREQLEEFRMDPARFLQEIQDVFTQVRGELLEIADQQTTDVETTSAQQRAACLAGFEGLHELASSASVEVENDELPSWVPFGVGQFSNGDDTLGLVMAVSQSAFALGAFGTLATFIYVESIARDERGLLMPGFESALVGLQVVNIITASIFAVLAIAGIVEARLSWQPTRTETEEREIPDDLRDPVRFCGSAEAGIALCF